jgi:hypothetical protein
MDGSPPQEPDEEETMRKQEEDRKAKDEEVGTEVNGARPENEMWRSPVNQEASRQHTK